MLVIDSGRVTNPTAITPTEIQEVCERKGRLIVQFSGPDCYTPATLGMLNEACRLARERLQVRFYGHYQGQFDAAILRNLPEIRDLAVDCLTKIMHVEEIGRLPNLIQLSFGVFEFDDPDFLNTLQLDQLNRLVLVENRKRNIDLTPLASCNSLSELCINGHWKGISAIANLPLLSKLSLGSYARNHDLDFISAIPTLRDLIIILGGRLDIEDMSNANLETLQILRVQGLITLGDLSRFRSLSALRVEDQLQLTQLDLSGADLERLWLFNCKRLAELRGLETQHRLREFRASQVALDMNTLRDRSWPQSARSVNLFSGSMKWNDDARARLDARGLGEKGALWP